jgi:hypothetical protein
MSYITLLLLLHVGGAIVGFGPAFAFPVLGPLSGRLGGPQALGIMKGMLKIQSGIIIPMAVLQGITGVLLIFAEGLDKNFWSQEWLWVSLLLYFVALVLAIFVLRPTLVKMVGLAEEGKAPTPEFAALVKKSQRLGPVLTLAIVTIIILMVVKPGA